MPFFVYLIVTCKIHYIHIEIFLIDDGTLQAYLYILNAKKIYYDIYIKNVILKSRECCVCVYHKIYIPQPLHASLSLLHPHHNHTSLSTPTTSYNHTSLSTPTQNNNIQYFSLKQLLQWFI